MVTWGLGGGGSGEGVGDNLLGQELERQERWIGVEKAGGRARSLKGQKGDDEYERMGWRGGRNRGRSPEGYEKIDNNIKTEGDARKEGKEEKRIHLEWTGGLM